MRQAPAVVGPEVEWLAQQLGDGEVLMLENSRFEWGETRNDPALVDSLARLGDMYVNDAFGAAHRAHATTEGVARRMRPAVAGFLLEREVTVLSSLLDEPEHPFVVVLGGAKVSDKIGVIERFLEIADAILIGGAMCFAFFRAMGRPTGDSLVEEEGVELARRALRAGRGVVVPARAAAGPRAGATASTPMPRPGWLTADSMSRTAGWGSTSARAHAEAYAQEIAAGTHGALERADGGVRARALRRGHARRGRGAGRRTTARRWSEAATPLLRWSASGWPTR